MNINLKAAVLTVVLTGLAVGIASTTSATGTHHRPKAVALPQAGSYTPAAAPAPVQRPPATVPTPAPVLHQAQVAEPAAPEVTTTTTAPPVTTPPLPPCGATFAWGTCQVAPGVDTSSAEQDAEPGAPSKVCTLDGKSWVCPESYIVPDPSTVTIDPPVGVNG